MTTGRSKPVPKDGASHSGSGSSSSLLGRRIIRKATLCRKLTYLKRAESPLSPKVSITTICDLCLLLRLPDRRGYFPLLCGSWLQFFCFSSIGTNYVDHSRYVLYIQEGKSHLHGTSHFTPGSQNNTVSQQEGTGVDEVGLLYLT